MKGHLYIHRAGSSPWMELLLLAWVLFLGLIFFPLIITLLIKIIILRYNV